MATDGHEHKVWFPYRSPGGGAAAGWLDADLQGPVAASGMRVDPVEPVGATCYAPYSSTTFLRGSRISAVGESEVSPS